jgi:hypothetical protein
MNNSIENDRQNILEKILQKENETLKKFGKNKIDTNLTLSSLISVLEMQREQINFLEAGKGDIYIASYRKYTIEKRT